MKSLIFSILTVAIIAGPAQAACPKITGEWLCKNAQGEEWTESVEVKGKTITVISDKGTPQEERSEIVADGQVRKESQSLSTQVQSIYNSAAAKAINFLPESMQAIATAKLMSTTPLNIDSFSIEGNWMCVKNKLIGKHEFSAGFSAAGLLSMTAVGTVISSQSLAKGKRVGTMKMNGIMSGKTSLKFMKAIEKSEAFNETEKGICTKIKVSSKK